MNIVHQANAAGAATESGGATSFGEYDANGVDWSLLRWMLRLSPLERLVVMERHANDTRQLLEYGRKHREAQAAGNR